MTLLPDEAYRFIKKNKNKLIEQFIFDGTEKNKRPIFIFMAGAPGAGKTEFSKNLIKILKENICRSGIVRIDADEIRENLKKFGYDGSNSDVFKRACGKGVEVLFDYCLKNKFHTVLDGTLSSLEIAERNIKAALSVSAEVFVIYIYQEPEIAWGFTKLREKKEGRHISKKLFIESLFQSIQNVNWLKVEYGKKIEVWLVEKTISHNVKKIRFNISNIDKHLKIDYSSSDLNNKLYE